MKTIIGKSYLTEIPHEGGEISFQYPSFKGTYANVAEQIDKDNLKRPNSAETASLVYDACKNPEEKTRMSALYKDWVFGGRLDVDGDSGGSGDNGRAFGVCKK